MRNLETRTSFPSSPAAPRILSANNQEKIQRLEAQFDLSPNPEALKARCRQRVELCQLLQKADPQNPAWRYGEQFFQTFPQGPERIWQLFEKWGVFQKKGELTPPPGLKEAQPREIMDLDELTLKQILSAQNLSKEEGAKLSQLADKAVEICWRQYQVVKEGLLRASPATMIEIAIGLKIGFGPILRLLEAEKKYLLADDFVGKTAEMAKKYGLPIVALALSADEIDAFQAQYSQEELVLVGIAKGFSSVLQEKIDSGQVKKIQTKKEIEPRKLSPGVYLLTTDAGDGLPFPENSACLAMMNGLHHNSAEQQLKIIKEMVRVAFKPRPDEAAVHIVEPYNSPHLLRMVLEANQNRETSGFDAMVGTTICGSQTLETFKRIAQAANSLIDWKTSLYPNLPPFDRFQEKRLCYQQVGLRGC